MRQIVEAAVEDAPDMMLLDDTDAAHLEASVARFEPDVVITTAVDDGDQGRAAQHRMLVDHPRLKLIVISRDGTAASLMEFRHVIVDDVSPTTVIQAIRAALRRTASRDIQGVDPWP